MHVRDGTFQVNDFQAAPVVEDGSGIPRHPRTVLPRVLAAALVFDGDWVDEEKRLDRG